MPVSGTEKSIVVWVVDPLNGLGRFWDRYDWGCGAALSTLVIMPPL
jgi:hypothetical protein